jgi:hypothetical protein
MVAANLFLIINFNVFFQSLSSIPLQSMNDSNVEQSVGSSKDFPPSQSRESSIIDDNFIPPPPSLGMFYQLLGDTEINLFSC